MNAQPRGRASRQPETATITDISHEGRGVAHVDGKTVFIDDALPGEVVEWQRLKRNRNFDEGRLLRVIEPSPDRIEPRCAHFGVCGGCVLQHLSGERQLEFKQRQLTEALARIGKVTPDEILPPLQSAVWNYRRRARLAARWVPKKNRTVVGFRERSTPYIADLKRCEVLQAPIDR
jgi:23S rRNA (uracil1939-C5)-methyltransferase